jgi:acyl-CoA reductase-like NAD-dependent aldehyde dehydrogenase
MLRVPILRAGRPYFSKETVRLVDYATARPVAEVSQANPGLISRDLLHDAWPELQRMTSGEALDRLGRAASHFMDSELPVGESSQTPEEFVAAQSATTGLPYALCRQNMEKIRAAMANMAAILDGLTGGLDLAALDAGYGRRDGHTVSFAPRARRFGAVLPANSPGVHALWLPAVAFRMPLALKPGQQEPWTPLRILESLRAAGFPETGLGLYPSGHDGAGVILRRCGASMLFGSGATVRPWQGNPQIEIHGPGYSKIVLGPDTSASWREFLDLTVTSVAANGGRSCINASSIRTPSHSRELAEALAERLSAIVPRARDDAQATLAAFPDPRVAEGIDAAIERGLAQGGAEDITARYRGPQRLVRSEGGTYLLPTVIHCQDTEHPLANQEYLFPFVSVVEVSADRLCESLGPSLVVTLLSEDAELQRDLMARADIGRLNLGPIPTTTIQWDQPHEGNLFLHLFQPRAFQRAPLACGAGTVRSRVAPLSIAASRVG